MAQKLSTDTAQTMKNVRKLVNRLYDEVIKRTTLPNFGPPCRFPVLCMNCIM